MRNGHVRAVCRMIGFDAILTQAKDHLYMTLPDRGSVDRRQHRLDSQSTQSCWLLMRYARLNNYPLVLPKLPQNSRMCACQLLHLVIRTYSVSSTTDVCCFHATIPTEILIINVTGFIFANMYLFCIQYKSVPKLHTTWTDSHRTTIGLQRY